ncbi:MAG: hypothetical protein H6934_08505 [Burkholderiaceae bacterium]|nr:hypothetical protein [Burkholderiaceae bacterium]
MRVAGKRGARRRLAAAGVALALGACGFHLRESANLPFESLHPAFAPNSTLGVEFKRALRAATNTRIEPDRNQAQAILVSMTERREKEITVFSSAGRPREYQLRLVFQFALVDPRGVEMLKPTTITLRREITASDLQLLSKEQEEVLLYREMQTDMVQQVLRRLSLIRVAKP